MNEINKGMRHIKLLIIGNIIFLFSAFSILNVVFGPHENIELYLNNMWW
jgi:hypothetical protein